MLSDNELRAVWRASVRWDSPYAVLVRFILLTATRLREASNMRRDEVSGNEWLIPAPRHKSKTEFLLPLSMAAQDLLRGIPVIGRRGWVFTYDGQRPINGFTKAKRELDRRVLEFLRQADPTAKPLPRWTNHDLRRTARSLMSRAGVDPDHAERCLGHVLAGVRGTYDRHQFAEKTAAFEALAQQIDLIVNPQVNVAQMRASDRTLAFAHPSASSFHRLSRST